MGLGGQGPGPRTVNTKEQKKGGQREAGWPKADPLTPVTHRLWALGG